MTNALSNLHAHEPSRRWVLPKRDGHTHTEFCPHGSREETVLFIQKAIELGFESYSLTEHPPLPIDFPDPAPDQSCGMVAGDLEPYLRRANALKAQFSGKITIHVGLEVDFIPGYEETTRKLLDQVGPQLADSVLSVHFVPGRGGWRCVDFSAEDFKEGLLDAYGSIEAVHEAYWETLEKAIDADLGPFKPRRLGHLSLVHKFQKRFPLQDSQYFYTRVCGILDKVRAKGMELDLNAAGLFKPDCQEIYPAPWMLVEAVQREIPLVYGSDAHSVKGVGQGFDEAERLVRSMMPPPHQS
ncbi:MAG: histidinol-phosphatase HisJ [Terriglobia bacterium]